MSSNLPEKFTYPFCYTPHPIIQEAAARLIDAIGNDPGLDRLFGEGKMLGILAATDSKGEITFLYGFSGLAGGKSTIDGFVPPIFDTTTVNIDSSSPEESVRLQEWLFRQYIVSNGRGENASILEIFAQRGLVPPGGTGDCAAPKMLQDCYRRGLKPRAMGEFWYGKSPKNEVRRSGRFYPSCTGKCGPLLSYMMQGLDVDENPLESDRHWSLTRPVILFEDEHLIVVDKPSGMLSVPGRVPRRSLAEWLSDYCETPVFSCHRLDMDTSGLMVFAKSVVVQSDLQRQFEDHSIAKNYIARLSAADEKDKALQVGEKGKIILPLSLDYYDRPRQMVDRTNGKQAVTEYEVLKNNSDGTSDVLFTPYTGRTHQLRVHAAHPEGLGRPIVGDRLYGGDAAVRLMLHANRLVFKHPVSRSRMTFTSDSFSGVV